MRWIVGVALVGLGAGACGSKATITTGQLRMCAPDGAAWVTIPSPDAGAGAAAVELSCPGTLSDYCYHVGGCPPPTWAEAIAQQNATGNPPQLTICDRYNWADSPLGCGNSGLDGLAFAYDKTTGKLLAAVELSAPGTPDQEICLAGPATLGPLESCTAYYDCFPNDAGFPKGHCYGDGGVDAAAHGG